MDGFVESIGSSHCVSVSHCAKDKPGFWTLYAFAALIAAVLQLSLVSDVWCPSRGFPKGKIKLVAYFFQVVAA